jgi:hypothetical protein
MSAEVRRLAPPDRRAPITVTRDMCTLGLACNCCPLTTQKWHGNPRYKQDCTLMHPPADRLCSPPRPKAIAPCPEREALVQDPPRPTAGHRPLLFSACVDCGRITARRWTHPDGQILPWCAGLFPKPTKI